MLFRSAIRYAVDGPTPFEVVNLGGSRSISLARLIRVLEEALGEQAIIDRQPLQPGDLPLTRADISKARRLFGYQPATPIEVGVQRFVEWLRAPAMAAALRRAS